MSCGFHKISVKCQYTQLHKITDTKKGHTQLAGGKCKPRCQHPPEHSSFLSCVSSGWDVSRGSMTEKMKLVVECYNGIA